jgi:urease accessory protein
MIQGAANVQKDVSSPPTSGTELQGNSDGGKHGMTALKRHLHQRSHGEIHARIGPQGILRLREVQASKVRFPGGCREAILINTGGGLAGGDSFEFSVAVEAHGRLSVTTQAAERVYRTLGPPASVLTRLSAGDEAHLGWLPNETILFDGASLSRELHADIAESAAFLAVEMVVFGRKAMGETITSISLRDRWRIRRGGRLVFADDLVVRDTLPTSLATLDGAGAIATIIFVAPEAEQRLDRIRNALGQTGAASAWDGKLVARLLAKDGFELKTSLIPAMFALLGGTGLPKTWTM